MKKTFYVQGMDCISCETVLRDALEEVPTIKVVSLKHKTGKLEMEYESPADIKKLEDILKQHNYRLSDHPSTTTQKTSHT
jgi:copper chaperone CopZ